MNWLEKISQDYGFVEDESGQTFWGKQGSGCLFVRDHPEYGRQVLLMLRSPHVEDPETWGIPGGAVKVGHEDPLTSALEESYEECGSLPDSIEKLRHRVIQHHVWRVPNGSFTYTTFIIQVDNLEWEPTELNWESSDFDWLTANEVRGLDDLHFGVDNLLEEIGWSVFSGEGEGEHAWYDLDDPLITVYHGTRSGLLPIIRENGLQPSNVEYIVNTVIEDSGFNVDSVPSWVKNEIQMRGNKDFVFVSLSPSDARGYAESNDLGGEIATVTRRSLESWVRNQGFEDMLRPPQDMGTPVVIKIDMPRRLLMSHHGDVNRYFARVVQNLSDSNKNISPADVFKKNPSEFFARTIPPQYITTVMS